MGTFWEVFVMTQLCEKREKGSIEIGEQAIAILGEMVWLVYVSLSILAGGCAFQSVNTAQTGGTHTLQVSRYQIPTFLQTYLNLREPAFGCGTASNSFPGWLE
jgi:hypothetical protein